MLAIQDCAVSLQTLIVFKDLMITSSFILSRGQGQGDVWQGGPGSECLVELRHIPRQQLD